MIDFSRNYFELFGLPSRFSIDSQALDHAYRTLQGEVHPDRFAAGTDAERRVALQSSARVNEAYRALRDPVLRATHLLSLHGVAAHDETDTALALEFLERQLERREQASDAVHAKDARTLEALLAEVRGEMHEREIELVRLLDNAGAWGQARDAVRELRFLAKLADDIDASIAALDP